jgi:ABC-type Co2+ transport system permease subunit
MFLGALAGGVSVLLTCLTIALFLHLSNPVGYAVAVKALVIAHIPVAAVEAAVVGAAVAFLHKVRPDLLVAPAGRRRREEAS